MDEYRKLLNQSKMMIFLSEHESQGLACQECLSCNVPVMAWDQGCWLDPIRFRYGKPYVPATSVPYFDERCGDTFVDFGEFMSKFDVFYENAVSGKFQPREYILEHLTIDKSTDRLLEIYKSI